jgi:hypothetical protein
VEDSPAVVEAALRTQVAAVAADSPAGVVEEAAEAAATRAVVAVAVVGAVTTETDPQLVLNSESLACNLLYVRRLLPGFSFFGPSGM